MRNHIVGDQQLRATVRESNSLRRVNPEEHVQGWDLALTRHLRSALRWLNSQARDAALLEVLQQIAIVAGHFHHGRVAVEAKAIDHVHHILLAMLEPTLAVAAEVGVILVEHLVCSQRTWQLNQLALIADIDTLRIGLLGFHERFVRDHAVAWWGCAQVNEDVVQFGVTGSAFWVVHALARKT